MKILAIDTSAAACSLALLVDGQISSHHELAPLQQAQIILPSINALLKSAAVSLKQLDAIAFGRGPGSFTGIRIATSIAQGLSFGANVPLVAISSLAALAQAAYDELGWDKLLVAADARINEVYWGVFAVSEGWVQLLGNERVCPPEDVDLPGDQGWYGVGNGWEVYGERLHYKPMAVDATRLPMASAVARLAALEVEKGACLTPEQVLPVYLRNNVVK